MLPLATLLIIIAIVLAFSGVIIFTFVRTCQDKRKNPTRTEGNEELDRFLSSEDSEDEFNTGKEAYMKHAGEGKEEKRSLFDNASENRFHLVDINVPNENRNNDGAGTGKDSLLENASSPTVSVAKESPQEGENSTSLEQSGTSESTAKRGSTDAANLDGSLPHAPSDAISNATSSLSEPNNKTESLDEVSRLSNEKEKRGRMQSLLSQAEKFRENQKEKLATAKAKTAKHRSASSDDVYRDSQNERVKGGRMQGLLVQAEKLRHLNRQRSMENDIDRITPSFALSAVLKMSLQYLENMRCLRGKIDCIEGLDYQSYYCPKEIKFHLRFMPSKRFHIKTKYRPLWNDSDLSLTFTLGPVNINDLSNNKLRVKLYGKRDKLLKNSRCYGECLLNLDELVNQPTLKDFELKMQPIESGPITYSSDSDLN